MRRYIATLFMVLALAGAVASAATHYVPTDFGTITAALAAAEPYDTIVVTEAYQDYVWVNGDWEQRETFPILVQKNNITIQARGDVTIRGEDSHAVFVVGAFRVFNERTHEYEYQSVSGVTIDGFNIIGTADIGIVVKHADNAEIINNTIMPGMVNDSRQTILEGIRLIEASNCTIRDNTIVGMGGDEIPANLVGYEGNDGIGINVERSAYNMLEGNTVTHCGLGLFMHESSRNSVEGDTYTHNQFGGVVLNNTAENGLEGLTVTDNGGWGVRFVHAYDDHLMDSVVTYNLGGGVQLIASEACEVDGNLIASNGALIASSGSDPDSYDDNVQVLIAAGDKALFGTHVFDRLNTLKDEDGNWITKPMSDFVLEKHQIEKKLDLLDWWLDDLNDELDNIEQRVTMGNENQAERELKAILRGRDPFASARITRSDIAGNDPVDATHHGMLLPEYNFTWWDHVAYGDYDDYEIGQHPFDQALLNVGKLDFYSDPQTPSFGLSRGSVDDGAEDADELMWDKIGLISILIEAIENELANTFYGVAWCHERGFIETTDEVELLDSLQEKLDHWRGLGLITQDTYDDLNAKLAATINLTARLRRALIGDGVDGFSGGILIGGTQHNIAARLVRIGENLDDLDEVKAAIQIIEAIKAKMHADILDFRHKLALLDLELPPFAHVNSDLIGKKEKPFSAITDDEIRGPQPNPLSSIRVGLNNDDIAVAIREGLLGSGSWSNADIAYDLTGQPTPSVNNVISSNIITSDLPAAWGRNVGIVIASDHNAIVNNLITNEGLPELDDYLRYLNNVGDDPIYAQIYRLDVGMILLADECLIAYNALEFLDWGIKRGGEWKWEDYQLEYIFTKLAHVSYWPGPGQVLELDRYDEVLKPGDKFYPPMAYVDYVPVLRLQRGDVSVSLDRTVIRNRLSLNFFDQTGTGIEIFKAHSNTIDENLFYKVSTANIIFRESAGPEAAGILLEHNDHFGGKAVANYMSEVSVNASADYTPPAGPGHAGVVGDVQPPGAPEPFAFANFLTIDKFVILENWAKAKGFTVALQQYQWDGLPPNLDFFGLTITLPEEKPRHPAAIFDDPDAPPVVLKRTLGEGYHLLSVPVVPEDNSPGNVFKAVTDSGQPLLMAEWVDGDYQEPAEIIPGRGYWMFLFDEVTIEVTGDLDAVDWTVELPTAGWHIVSTPKWPIAWSGVRFHDGTEEKSVGDAVGAGWIAPYFVAFNRETGDYEYILFTTAGAGMNPWRGYWIMTEVPNLTMILPNDWPAPPLSTSLSVGLTAADIPAQLRAPAPPALSALGAGPLTALSYPNPVSDGTATFVVAGFPVAEVRVSVFSMGGHQVWQAEAEGNRVVWNLSDSAGRAVANGVYLFYMEARIGNQWLSTRVERLLIIR